MLFMRPVDKVRKVSLPNTDHSETTPQNNMRSRPNSALNGTALYCLGTLVVGIGAAWIVGLNPNRPVYIPPQSVYVGELQSVEFYEAKMVTEPYFEWIETPEVNYSGYHDTNNGPGRALAYIGDPAVPALFRLIENPRLHDVDLFHVRTALSYIGLPVHEKKFWEPLLDRNAGPLREWWEENQQATKKQRSQWRLEKGLPPIP